MANESIIASGVQGTHIRAFGEIASERFAALQIELALIYLVDRVDVDALLPLASQFDVLGVKGWMFADTEQKKRDLIKKAIELHRYKGTPWAIKEALASLGYSATLIERPNSVQRYFDGSIRYTGDEMFGTRHWSWFKATISLDALGGYVPTIEERNTAIAVINEYKNARSHLLLLAFGIQYVDTVNVSDSLNITVNYNMDSVARTGLSFDGSMLFDGSRRYDGDQFDLTIS